MPTKTFDVIVVGAGAAGLAASHQLSHLGLNVVVLEARNRIGGRILTEADHSVSIELGAEFLHGRPEVLLSTIREADLAIDEVVGDRWMCAGRSLKKSDDVTSAWEGVSKEMKLANSTDQTFEAFLQ